MTNKLGKIIGMKELDLSDSSTAQQILHLQQAVNEAEADMIERKGVQTHRVDTLEQLMDSDEKFLGYYLAGTLIAALSYKRDGTEMRIFRMLLDPKRFRKGIAINLLEFLARKEKGVESFLISTRTANGMAIRLYEKLGFSFIDETVVDTGLKLAHLKKHIV